MNNKTNEKKSETRQKIIEMLEKIENNQLLDRIYRFVRFLYIHKT